MQLRFQLRLSELLARGERPTEQWVAQITVRVGYNINQDAREQWTRTRGGAELKRPQGNKETASEPSQTNAWTHDEMAE